MTLRSRTPRRSRLRFATSTAVVVAVLAPLAACSTSEASEASEASEGGAPLEVWTRSNVDGAATYTRIFEAFTEQTGIEVDYQPVIEFDTQLQARAAQEDVPDILINDAGSLGAYVAQGLIAPIEVDSVEGGDQIPDATWQENVATDGQTYGVPFSRQAAVLIGRKDWRENLGLELPETWDDLDALATAFATQDPDGNGVADTYGMAVPGTAESGYIARWGAPYIWQAGGELLEEDDGAYSSVVDSPETIEGLEFIRKQFCTPGNVVPGSINYDTSDALGIEDGSAGLYLTGGYKLNGFDAAVGRENIEVIPMPEGPDSATTFAEGENIYFGSTRSRTEDRLALASFLVSEEGQKLGMDSPAAGGDGPFNSVVRLPVNENVDTGAEYDDPRWALIADAYAAEPHKFPWNINFIPFRQVLADGMNAMMADCDSDIPALLEQIDQGFEAEIATQGLGG